MNIARQFSAHPLRAAAVLFVALITALLMIVPAFLYAFWETAQHSVFGRMLTGVCYDNTIDPGLKREKILNRFMQTFAAALMPITGVFATDMDESGVDEGDEVSVPYIPMASAAVAFDGTYTAQDTQWEKKKVTVDKHFFVSMGLSDKDVFKTPYATLEQQADQKAYQLAKAVLVDVFGEITAANFPGVCHTGVAGNFDTDDVADISGDCDDNDFPEAGRGLVLSRPYYTNVVKDNTVQDASASGTTAPLIEGVLPPRLHGFQPYKTTLLPNNGENLTGFASLRSAIGFANRYLKPQEGHTYKEARPIVHPSGLVVGFRDWYDNDTGVRKQVFEALWGKKVIEPKALRRVRSA